MPEPDPTENFVKSLTASQNRLYGYIYSLVGDHHRAEDVLQECNMVLWRKAGEFPKGSEFIPWAFGVARFQVMANLRDRNREQERLLNPELAELMADELEEQAGQFDDLHATLLSCIKLPGKSRQLMDQRYYHRLSIQQIADATERKLSAVKVALMRVRQGLKLCVDRERQKAK